MEKIELEKDPQFQKELVEEIYRGGQLRSMVLAVTFFSIFFLFIIGEWADVLPLNFDVPLWGAKLLYWQMGMQFVVALAELIFWSILRWRWMPRSGIKATTYLISFIEMSIPTGAVVMHLQISPTMQAMNLPPVLLYSLFIILLVLFLEPFLCIFAGVIAFVEYSSLAFYAIDLHGSSHYEMDQGDYVVKGLFFLLNGVLASLVAREIKKRMINTFQSQLRSQHLILKNKEEALEKQRQLTQAYQRFVPQEFLGLLGKKSIVEVELGDQVEQCMSILFSDIRSFTSISEKMTPEANFSFINHFLKDMGPLIRQHEGYIDKYIGDAIMALFPQNADDALQAAISMLSHLDVVNSQASSEHPPIKIGIGINTGHMMLGTVGEPDRMEGTAISDAVNVASRLEGLSKFYGTSLLISEHTLRDLKNPDHYDLRFVDCVKVKGKEQPVKIFEVFDADSPEVRAKKKILIPLFNEAWQMFHNKKYDEAQIRFEECSQEDPEDQLYSIFVQQCQENKRKARQL